MAEKNNRVAARNARKNAYKFDVSRHDQQIPAFRHPRREQARFLDIPALYL